MGHRFAEITFTDSVREVQRTRHSKERYSHLLDDSDYNDRLGERETAFITARDSFYMASVNENGWPYVQHRGGPAGFMRVLDAKTLGFADFAGNRQYLSTGNLQGDGRIALFFMDYPSRTRLKLLGRARIIQNAEKNILRELEVDDYRARVEHGVLITVEAFDWNCPQHITPRFTEAEIAGRLNELKNENQRLRAELETMKNDC